MDLREDVEISWIAVITLSKRGSSVKNSWKLLFEKQIAIWSYILRVGVFIVGIMNTSVLCVEYKSWTIQYGIWVKGRCQIRFKSKFSDQHYNLGIKGQGQTYLKSV